MRSTQISYKFALKTLTGRKFSAMILATVKTGGVGMKTIIRILTYPYRAYKNWGAKIAAMNHIEQSNYWDEWQMASLVILLLMPVAIVIWYTTVAP